MSVALEEWTNLSHKKRRAVSQCADLNYQIPSADAAGIVAQLDFPIRAAVIKAWEAHPREATFLRDVCLSSTTEWDVRTRKLLVNPRVLANALWLALLDHRLQSFWADLREQLTPHQLQELVAWYRAMIQHRTKQDASVVLPSYMDAG